MQKETDYESVRDWCYWLHRRFGGRIGWSNLDTKVLGLVRSEAGVYLLKERKIEPVLGSLDDADVLTQAAMQSDGVIHAASADYQGVLEVFV